MDPARRITADIVVIFSTFNGSGRIERVLDGYLEQVTRDVDWKIVAVNNASTDDTEKILNSYVGRLPLHILNEERPGKNHALNLAVDQVHSRLVIFTDDDAIPAMEFIQQWSTVLNDHMSFDIFGAMIDPIFDTPPPPWLIDDVFPFNVLYAAQKQPEGQLNGGEVFGPNMAVRGTVFERGHRFDHAIGPNSSNKNYTMGSETEFCLRMETHGFRCYFLPGPKVHHIVRTNQMTMDFVTGRAERFGKGRAQYHLAADKVHPKVNVPYLRFFPDRVRSLGLQVRIWLARTPEDRNKLIWEKYFRRGFVEYLRTNYKR